ncbi:hypothetical protein ALQ18_00740 [Pseudomonas marginalis pv. marginalis]|nr:hypothetical protein ALQ18_00740 [Pseudomonas marginalis pv. marginalis]
MFHEMAHAYNGATGTFLAGETTESPEPGESRAVPNFERQAIRLASDAEPFDLDNNLSTLPSAINPYPFTENALNEEMGKPLRPNYLVKPSPQGSGSQGALN